MRHHVTAAHQEHAPVLEEASSLIEQKQNLETKKALLNAFNQHFILSDDELMVLTNMSDPVDERFFLILKKVKQIYTDCQILLGNENERLGLELMDQRSRNLNSAYQKLYKWIQREFKTLNLENPQISSMIRRALRALAQRPTLFQSCLDFFAEAREHVLTDAFYSALTGSSADHEQNPLTKPIEFYAHDPLRYVGDMLAWTHSITVSEREALESLFISDGDEIAKVIQAGRESEPWSAVDGETFDGQKALGDLVNRNLAGVAKVLRQRVEQVIQNHEDPILIYRITNPINFYRITFRKLLGSESSILETLSILEESALRQFRTITEDHVVSLRNDLNLPSPSLNIPEFLDEALVQLTALLKSFDSTLTPASSREAEFQPILATALILYLDLCQKLAQKFEIPENDIFLTNCLLAAKAVLVSYDFVTTQTASLEDSLRGHISALTSHQHAFFLHASGLQPLLVALAPFSTPDSPLPLSTVSSLPAFSPDALSAASQTLDDFLPSAFMDAIENLKPLSSAKLGADITTEAADRFCSDFEFVEGRLVAADALREEEGEAVHEEDNGEGRGEVVPLKALFPRTTGEIRVLLS